MKVRISGINATMDLKHVDSGVVLRVVDEDSHIHGFLCIGTETVEWRESAKVPGVPVKWLDLVKWLKSRRVKIPGAPVTSAARSTPPAEASTSRT